MEGLYIYTIKVNIALFVFFLFYSLGISRDTFFSIRRLFFGVTTFLSFAYPFLSFPLDLGIESPLRHTVIDYAGILEASVIAVVPVENETGTWFDWLGRIWLIGSVVLSVRMFLQLCLVWKMVCYGEKIYWEGQQIIVLTGKTAPFSFGKWIFFNPASCDEREAREIILHEKAHVSQWHFLDIILGEILCIIFWFNPLVWLWKREIRQNLEFLADKKVLSAGYSRKDYQYHLLSLTRQRTIIPLVNKFNVSSLKKRIMMMNKKQTSRISLIKYILLVPMTGCLMVSTDAATVVKITENSLQEWQIFSVQDSEKEGKILTGKVVDENDEPLPGASVIVKGTVKGTLTDAEGKFRLKVTEPGVLIVSYVGKTPESRPFNQESGTFRIKLNSSRVLLDKVTITEYREKKKAEPEEEIFVVVEDMPSFPLGNVSDYITQHLRYPAIAKSQGIEGIVKVDFVVDDQGKVTDAKVVKPVDASLDQEALRVVNSMPDWKPGKQRGKAVAVQFSVPIVFRLMNLKTE